MLLKFIGCLSSLTAAATCLALSAAELPKLPEPVSNNAVASVTIRGKTYIASFMGIGPGKQHSDVHNKVFMHTLGEFGWHEMPDVPSQQRLQGRIAASAVALNNNFFVFGGFAVNADGTEQTAADSYRFDPITKRYTRLNDIPVPVDDAVALTYQNRYIYLVSGWSDHGNVNLVQVFDNYTQRWSQATPFPGKPVFCFAGHTACHVACLSPKAPLASNSWMFSVTPGSAIRRTRVLSSPTPAKDRVAATLAFLGYRRAASRAVASKITVGSVNASRLNNASAGEPRQPAGGLRPM